MNSLEIPILIKYREDDENVFQDFVFLTKKSNFKYLKDNRYLLNKILMKNIYEFALTNQGLVMLNIFTGEDKITIKYNMGEYKKDNKYFLVCGDIPKQMGCDYCKYKIDKGDYLVCAFQDNKLYTRSLKKCKYFVQKEN